MPLVVPLYSHLLVFAQILWDPPWQATLEKEKVTPVLHLVSEFSKGVIVLLYAGLSMMVLYWMLCGLPKKAPQHESVQDGCDTRSLVEFRTIGWRGLGVELQQGGTE